MKHLIRSSKTGRFIKRSNATTNIVNGRLYEYRGAVVRAKKLCNNGVRQVSFHNSLFGFVKDSELRKINKDGVAQYLSHALGNKINIKAF